MQLRRARVPEIPLVFGTSLAIVHGQVRASLTPGARLRLPEPGSVRRAGGAKRTRRSVDVAHDLARGDAGRPARYFVTFCR